VLTVEAEGALFRDRDLAGFEVRVHATGRRRLPLPTRHSPVLADEGSTLPRPWSVDGKTVTPSEQRDSDITVSVGERSGSSSFDP